jgi:hypothetical protein
MPGKPIAATQKNVGSHSQKRHIPGIRMEICGSFRNDICPYGSVMPGKHVVAFMIFAVSVSRQPDFWAKDQRKPPKPNANQRANLTRFFLGPSGDFLIAGATKPGKPLDIWQKNTN